MSTLTQKEIDKLAREWLQCDDDGVVFGALKFATALEAALRAKWFAEPVAWAYVSRDPLDGGDTPLSIHKPSRQDAIPLYAEPQEGS